MDEGRRTERKKGEEKIENRKMRKEKKYGGTIGNKEEGKEEG